MEETMTEQRERTGRVEHRDRKVAFIFPGQGSQTVGMGQELARNHPCAREVYRRAEATLGFPLQRLCAEGPEEELRATANTQPALVATSLAILAVLREDGLAPDVVAGHSVGEYTALAAAGVLPLEAVLRVVRRRGELMASAVPSGGAMVAILGLDREGVETACREAQAATGKLVTPANYNCPGQIVISGWEEAVRDAGERALALGAKRVIPLAVSGPFHSPLMAPAGRALAEALAAEEGWRDPQAGIRFIANASADYLDHWPAIRESLVAQLSSPVRWEESIIRLVRDGVRVFVEVGPGKVLSGLVKKIAREVEVYAVEDEASREKLLAFWERR